MPRLFRNAESEKDDVYVSASSVGSYQCVWQSAFGRYEARLASFTFSPFLCRVSSISLETVSPKVAIVSMETTSKLMNI